MKVGTVADGSGGMANAERTVVEMLSLGEERLRQAGVPDAAVDCQWLMAAALHCSRTELALRRREVVQGEERLNWERFLEKRSQRIPLQHILKKMSFAELTIAVDGRALIPRPETEELTTALVRCNPSPRRILDLGTGSGACILALGTAFPDATLTAVDNDAAALQLAHENAVLCGLDGRICWQLSDWFSQLDGTWDLIVANPPYLSQEEWETCADEVRLFDPRQALVSGCGGMADGQRILSDGIFFIDPFGILAMEIGQGQGQKLKSFAKKQGWRWVAVAKDLAGQDRFLFAAQSTTMRLSRWPNLFHAATNLTCIRTCA
jgi:release factor glutamine methyltransferase